jgi:hypothetical protein
VCTVSDLEEELRRLRDDVARHIRVSPEGAEDVLRRSRSHRVATALLALVTASVIVVAAVAGAGAITSWVGEDSDRPMPPASGVTDGRRELGLGEQEVTFAFLLGGRCYSLILPDDFEALPELSSPVSARSFDFVRPEHDVHPPEPIDTLEGRDGRQVEVAVLTEDPPQWSLRWELSNGALYTHVRGADGGRERAEVVASSVTIRDGACGPGPEIEVHPPLEPSVSEPPYQHHASFTSLERKEWTIILERPSRLPPGKTVVLAGDFGGFSAEKGTEAGLLVSVFVPTTEEDARHLLEMVADSLREQ